MKIKCLLLLLLFSYTMSAQLTISQGAQFVLTNGVQLTLQNAGLINNGDFAAGNGTLRFTGNSSSSINGNQPTRFFELVINKSNNSSVVLERAIEVANEVFFSSGFLDLNGFNTQLGNTGNLVNENENSGVIGENGGEVTANAFLNGPLLENPGNLGAVITSTQNLGNTIIKRGHQSQTGSGLASSILRYYDISPANNSNLDASLQLNYFDRELNGLDENTLVSFKTDDGVNWTNQGFNARSTSTNFVRKEGAGSFSRWTLSNPDNILPVTFISLNANCDGRKVLITWKTAQEQNSNHFDVERSVDGIRWTVIGSIPAAGNSSSEKNYSFTDNDPQQINNYRIGQYDIGGRVQYSSIVRSSCSVINIFTVWPNPAHGVVNIDISSDSRSQAVIKLFDTKGSLVKIQRTEILPGNNQLRVNIGTLANGIYSLNTVWNNGQMQKTVQVVKQ